MSDKWWHNDMSEIASQLSQGVLKEMKHRILTSNIQKEKLTLNESSPRMKAFFEKELIRYTNRKESLKQKNKDKELQKYKDIIRMLAQCNIELAIKCQKNNIKIEKITIHGDATCWH